MGKGESVTQTLKEPVAGSFEEILIGYRH